MFHLTVKTSEDEGTEYWLTRPEITLGCGTDNDIVVTGNKVAKAHARLRLSEDGHSYRIDALETKFGTFVNGKQIRSGLLESGDQIRFGTVEAILAEKESNPGIPPLNGDAPTREAYQAALDRISELEAQVEARETGMTTLQGKLATQVHAATEAQAHLESTHASLSQTQGEFQSFQAEMTALNQEMQAALLDAEQKEDEAVGAMTGLQEQLEAAEKRHSDLDASSRKRIQRGHDTISALRKKTAQQESEIREIRYEVMKLRRAKDASDTLLESVKRCYARDKKQHNRLVEQFRERARQESLRAESAMQQLAKAQSVADAGG